MAEARIVINGATVLSLLLIAEDKAGGDIPDIVEFAGWLSDAEKAEPAKGEWYDTCLPELLLLVGSVVQGEDPEIARISFYASAGNVERWA